MKGHKYKRVRIVKMKMSPVTATVVEHLVLCERTLRNTSKHLWLLILNEEY